MTDENVEVPAVVSVDCLNVDGYVPGEAVEVPAVSADLLNFVAYFGLVLGAVEEGFASSHCSAAAAVGTTAADDGAERPASQTEFLWSACPQLP